MYKQINSPAYELRKLSNDNEPGKQLPLNNFVGGDETTFPDEVESQDVVVSIPQQEDGCAGENINAYINQSFTGDTEMLFLILYNIYLGFAIHLTWSEVSSYCHRIKLLSVVTITVYCCVIFKIVIKPFLLKPLLKKSLPFWTKLTAFKHFSKVTWSLIWLAVVIFLVVDSENNRYRLVSASGLVVLLFVGFIFSANPTKIIWRHVQWGVLVQFVMSLIILRWSVGRAFFQCLGEKIKALLDCTDAGSSFVFGYLVTGHMEKAPEQIPIFAFKVLPVVMFFSFMVSILYYYGWMQIAVVNVGWLLQQTVGTTACESMNAAANIFLGMTEAPIIIRPYLPIMTKSELHAVLTGGFATIAGSVMAAYINFGISASHLVSASVMSAPAALAFSKLVYPETEESVTRVDNIIIEKGKETNALEAASNGASTAVTLVAYIVANLIAFVAFISFVDGLLSWLGSLVRWNFISFEWLMSKLFMPLSLVMGVEWKDSEKVAQLIGLKTVVNEFVAYKKLSDFQKDDVLSARSEAIATFALCGFSNIGSIGIQLGTLGALVPERKPDLAKLVVRAMLAGSAACFMTACVAGTLLTEYD